MLEVPHELRDTGKVKLLTGRPGPYGLHMQIMRRGWFGSNSERTKKPVDGSSNQAAARSTTVNAGAATVLNRGMDVESAVRVHGARMAAITGVSVKGSYTKSIESGLGNFMFNGFTLF